MHGEHGTVAARCLFNHLSGTEARDADGEWRRTRVVRGADSEGAMGRAGANLVELELARAGIAEPATLF